ncbi:MAG: DsbA family oxidoreductase [Granulosicoccus sp.]
MTKHLKIDFVSDVSCPWCAVGLGGLEQALSRLEGEVIADIHFQPFELNPAMVAEGQDIVEHLTQKYGATEAQQIDIRNTIRERGAEVGFEFNPDGRGRIWNTFDLHRLLHLAEAEGQPGQQATLKKALLAACHTRSERMGDHAVLTACAVEAGLDEQRVKAVLDSDEFSKEVRERQSFYSSQGISSVPAVIINDKHLISGGQPTDVFVQVLRQIAAEV